MEEQNNSNPRPQIPIWGWILGILAIVLVVQFWTSGNFGGADQLSAREVADRIRAGEVEELELDVFEGRNRGGLRLRAGELLVLVSD